MRTKRFMRSRAFKVLLAVAVALIGLRVALPFIVKDYVNETLDELEDYSGSIDDIDLHLWRGAYEIEGVDIVKTDGQVPAPFLSASEIDLSVQWGALLDGAIVAELDVIDPKLNFVSAPKKSGSQEAPGDNWQRVVRDLVPIDINRFSIRNGEIHFRNFKSEPKVDIYVQKLNATVRNLTNATDSGKALPTTFDGDATAMGSGKIDFKGAVDPFAKNPTFDANVKLEHLSLEQLNDYFRAYANLDVEKGTLDVDGEFAASDGRFEGYVKPFVKDLDVVQWQKENDPFFNKIWQGLTEAIGKVITDRSEDRIATKVPFSGRLDNPDADVWATLGGLLRNAFIESLRRGIEDQVGRAGPRAED